MQGPLFREALGNLGFHQSLENAKVALAKIRILCQAMVLHIGDKLCRMSCPSQI